MQAFDYIQAHSVEEATALLQQAQGAARVLSGGSDLIVALRERRLRAEVVVDVKPVPELQALHYDHAAGLTIGACTSCLRIYSDPTVTALYPGLVDAARLIGGIQIQGRAGLGGNLCNASPAADSIPALIAHHAVAEVAGPYGRRRVPVEDFCTGPGRTVLAPGELLVALHLPPPAERSGAAYLRFIPRNEMDIAVAGVAVALTLDPTLARFTGGRIALAAVGPTPILVTDGVEALADGPADDATVAQLAAAAQRAARPITDLRGTAEHRRQLVEVLTRRALALALARARKESV